MKIPLSPPPFESLLASADERGASAALRRFAARHGPAPAGRYLHWDELRHRPPPDDLSSEDWWASIALARLGSARPLPLSAKAGHPLRYCLTDQLLEQLHRIDQRASGRISAPAAVMNEGTRDQYLVRSLIEEAVTSSQLEGAATTRRVARDMLRQGRDPVDRSEQMIANNYRAIQLVRNWSGEPLTPARLLELQSVLTKDTLDDPDASGRWRRHEDDIVVMDQSDGSTLHVPPAADQLETRIDALCRFANGDEDGFIHPLIRAIVLHFMVGYDHPFVDGNGRTARALFYWCMARQGYWLMAYASVSRRILDVRAQYHRAYLHCETDHEDVTYFLLFHARIILQALDALDAWLVEKAESHERLRRRLTASSSTKLGLNHRQIEALLRAERDPMAMFTIASHRASHGVTYQTARTDLQGLVLAGLLEQRKVGKAFEFRPPADLAARLARLSAER